MNKFASYYDIIYNVDVKSRRFRIKYAIKEENTVITKEMVIGQVLRAYPQTAEVFMELGMHCLGCPSATMESVEGAAITHGKDPDELVEELNKVIGQ